MSCVFCDIVSGKFGTEFLYEDEFCVAFNDIAPQAPVHVLIIPKAHIATLNDAQDPALLGHMMLAAQQCAKDLGIAESGYRLVMNCNEDGGQEVFHIHLHLLGGQKLGWPPFAS